MPEYAEPENADLPHEPWHPPDDYIEPSQAETSLPIYRFVREYLDEELPHMLPVDTSDKKVWCLANPGRVYLVYAVEGGKLTLDLSSETEAFAVRWVDSRTCRIIVSTSDDTEPGRVARFEAPGPGPWVLWLRPPELQPAAFCSENIALSAAAASS